MSLENPFRPHVHHAPTSNSRRFWNLFLVSALGLSVLWLSWSLLIDDYENPSNVEITNEREALIDDEEDTRILNQETRLRTKSHDLGEVPKSKHIPDTPVVTHEDDDDDEEENIGDDHHDEDTVMHEDKMHRQIEAAAQKKLEKMNSQEKKLGDISTSAKTKEVNDVKDKFPSDNNDDDDEIPTERIVDNAKTSTKATKSNPDEDPLIHEEDDAIDGDKEEGNENGEDNSHRMTDKESGNIDLEKPLLRHPTSENNSDEGDEDNEGRDADELHPAEIEIEDHDEEVQPTNEKSSVFQTKIKPAEDTEVPPPPPDQGDDDSDFVKTKNADDDDVALSPGKTNLVQDVDGDDQHISLKGASKTIPVKPRSSELDEEDSLLGDEVDDEDAAGSDMSMPKKYASTSVRSKSSIKPEDWTDDVPNEEDDYSPSTNTQKPALSTSAKFPKPGTDKFDGVDDDTTLENDEILAKQKNLSARPASPSKPKITKNQSTDHIGINSLKKATEGEEVDDGPDANREGTRRHSTLDSKLPSIDDPKPDKNGWINGVGDGDENEELDHVSNESPEVSFNRDEDFSDAHSSTKLAEVYPDGLENGSGDSDDNSPQILSCESIRKKLDCDGRDDCKWKYPHSQTTGFFCESQHKCDDIVAQRKSKCLAIPRCTWIRLSPTTYGCRSTSDAATSSLEAQVDESKFPESDSSPKTNEMCIAHSKKAKCIADNGCSWEKTSTHPTTYGCRVSSPLRTDEGESNGEDDENDGEEPDDNSQNLDIGQDDYNKDVPANGGEDDQRVSRKSVVISNKIDDSSVSDEEMQGEDSAADLDQEEALGNDSTPPPSAPLEGCSTIRLKSACQLRTDCYWKYPVSYSSGKYCTERQLSIKVTPERAQIYEALMSGKTPLFVEEAMNRPTNVNSKFKTLGPDWKRYRTDVSCSLHPECVTRENATREYLTGFPLVDMPPTYVRAQCCATHPPLRQLFFQVVEFLNREGIPWWMSSKDAMTTLFADGFLLPWTTQVIIEVPIFGSKSAVDWASTHELRANITSATTRTRILRSTKNEFASKLLQFNADPQNLPNAMRVCMAKFVMGTEKKSSSSASSYSSDWLKSEKSGDEQCLVISKSSKISSSKTPTYFLVSHVDEVEGKGPTIKIVPRILRTASADSCMESWRPGSDFESIPVHMIFPTVPCFDQGKFQGFTGVSRCAKDTNSYIAWQMAAKGKEDLLSPDARIDYEELRKWTEIDLCSRGLIKQ